MKLLILTLCFCLAVAYDNAQLMDDLEMLLSEDSNSPAENKSPLDNNSPLDISILNKLDELDAKQPEPFEDSSETEKRGFRFGKCLDGITPADGPHMRGCPRKLCYDAFPGTCSRALTGLNPQERRAFCLRKENFEYFRPNCPYSCGFCKQQSPTLECRKKYGTKAKYGCCWDGMPALKPDKSDCIACVDLTPHTCRQFNNNMYGVRCGSNSYRIRHFLYSRCARLCGRCNRRRIFG